MNKNKDIIKNLKRITDLDIKIGARIKKIRLYKGLSQKAVAKILNISIQQVQKYEEGKNRISASKIVLFAQKLNIPISQLLEINEFDHFIHDEYAFCILSDLKKIKHLEDQNMLITTIRNLINTFIKIGKSTEFKTT